MYSNNSADVGRKRGGGKKGHYCGFDRQKMILLSDVVGRPNYRMSYPR